METNSPNSKKKMRFVIAPKVKQVFTFHVVVTSIVFGTLFMAFYLLFNLGRSKDAHAAGNSMTVVANGNWNSTSTWSLNRVPGNYDTLIVPAGKTLTVNIVTTNYTSLHIQVYGTIYFVSGKKIVMCPGEIQVYAGGKLIGESVGSKIDICSNMVWDGNDPGDGPLYFSGGALPITLTSFSGEASGKTVNLSWTTANEINNDYFTIEHASDGHNFTPVMTVKGAGNSTSDIYYQTKDMHPGRGINYYRLKQTDYDGKFEYFDIISVSVDNGITDGSIQIESVGPNPFKDDFNMQYTTNGSGTVIVTLVNSMGAVVRAESWPAEKGNRTWHFENAKNLASGIYFLTLTMNDKRVTKRLIKS
jgi:hypothetical protein